MTYDCNGNRKSNFSEIEHFTFEEFLYEVGMFDKNKFFEYFTAEEKEIAKKKYLNALSVSVQGTASVLLKREVKDIFVNAFNSKTMRVFQANMDLQICIDPYAATNYVCKYITKSESGMSLFLKAINDETSNLKQMERLNALANVLLYLRPKLIKRGHRFYVIPPL